MYKLYKQSGGELKWNAFQKLISNDGEIHISLINTTDEPVTLKTGDKVIQFMHLPVFYTKYQEVLTEDFEKLSPESDRGSCGFGSSDTN